MTLKDFVDRYGATLAIVAVLALLVILLPGNEQDRTRLGVGAGEGVEGDSFGLDAEGGEVGEGGEAGGIDGEGGGGGGGGGGGAGGGGGSGGLASGGGGGEGEAQVAVGRGPNCRPDRRQKGVSTYTPPCVEFSGSNGGETSRGVTGNQIKVIRFLLPIDPGTQAILEGAKLSDPPAVVKRAYEALRRYYNQHFETYGREVVYEDYTASGPGESDEAMKADAVRIASERKAFAVIEGNPAAPIPNVLATELAARGVVCICTVSAPSSYYQARPPYIFSSLPTISEYGAHIAEFIGKRMNGKPAKWAGDTLNPTQGYTRTNRKFGLILLEGARGKKSPEADPGREDLVRELARYGVRLTTEVRYMYDPGRNQQDVSTMVGRLKSAGVTTVIPYVDPLYPILITKEATRQQYFPEWFISGTGLSDTTAAGRLYDQSQWRHAFGISPLWVTWATVAKSPGYREFHHGMPGMRPGDEGVLINIYRAYPQLLFIGIQMAGPNLTPNSFAQGMFNYPRTGGKPAAPLVHMNRAFPTAIKDFIEVWYSATDRGPDERGENGVGMIMKVDVGKRYQLGQWPQADPKAFVRDGAVSVTDNPPGGGDPPHEQDGHRHNTKCLSCG